ncbi:MAG: hypothetical protein ABSG41_13475 [Bryobacteraceae bacterium]|jgi:hypothetical protein
MATAFLLAASVGSASAGQILNFSYTDREGDTFAGTLNGNLRSDNNTFLVTSISSLTLDTIPTVALPFVESWDYLDGSGHGYLGENLGAVTLNGSYFDIVTCDSASCDKTFAFAKGDESAGILIWGATFATQFIEGNNFAVEAFNPDGWSANIGQSTPEPGSLVFMSIALLAVVALKCNALGVISGTPTNR